MVREPLGLDRRSRGCCHDQRGLSECRYPYPLPYAQTWRSIRSKISRPVLDIDSPSHSPVQNSGPSYSKSRSVHWGPRSLPDQVHRRPTRTPGSWSKQQYHLPVQLIGEYRGHTGRYQKCSCRIQSECDFKSAWGISRTHWSIPSGSCRGLVGRTRRVSNFKGPVGGVGCPSWTPFKPLDILPRADRHAERQARVRTNKRQFPEHDRD